MIYAAIVVMWAVVLVPMWIHRHDTATESKSVERFSAAMRSLARKRPGRLPGRSIVMPRRLPDTMSWHVSGPAVRPKATRPARPTAGRFEVSRSAVIARRRHTLLGLLGLAGICFVLALVGAFPWLLQLLIDGFLVGYLAYLRSQARAGRPVAPAVGQRPVSARGSFIAPRRVDPAPVVVAEEPLAPAVGGESSWQPVPVPPPTYLTNSPVVADAWVPEGARGGRGGDLLGELGLWDDLSSDDTQEFAVFRDDEEGPLEHRRAVND